MRERAHFPLDASAHGLPQGSVPARDVVGGQRADLGEGAGRDELPLIHRQRQHECLGIAAGACRRREPVRAIPRREVLRRGASSQLEISGDDQSGVEFEEIVDPQVLVQAVGAGDPRTEGMPGVPIEPRDVAQARLGVEPEQPARDQRTLERAESAYADRNAAIPRVFEVGVRQPSAQRAPAIPVPGCHVVGSELPRLGERPRDGNAPAKWLDVVDEPADPFARNQSPPHRSVPLHDRQRSGEPHPSLPTTSLPPNTVEHSANASALARSGSHGSSGCHCTPSQPATTAS